MPSEPDWGNEPGERWGALLTQVGGLEFEGRVKTIAGCYQSFYQNIVEVIGGRAELAVKPEEARSTIRMIESAIESNEQKRTLPFSL